MIFMKIWPCCRLFSEYSHCVVVLFDPEENDVEPLPGHLYVSPRNEWLVLSTLRKLLVNKLANFETSIDHDLNLLKDPSKLSGEVFILLEFLVQSHIIFAFISF
jgi:hypothetical protein